MSEEYDDSKGGEQGYEGDGPNLRYDDFVGRLVQDPKDPQPVTLLSGYLGSSSEEGHVRLYLDEELCRYVEIPQKAIRHTQELPPEQSPLGGSLVWIDRDAEVLHGAAGSERRKATFLEGQIAQDYIGGAGGYNISGGGGTTTQTRECGSGGGGGILPTDMGPGCGHSQYGPCIPPTEVPGCRTLTGIFCTRFGPGCRKTLFEPNCTVIGPNCHTVLLHQCQSIYTPCVTQNQSYCVASGGAPCYPPIDFTKYEQGGVQQQFAQQAPFGGGGAAGGAQGFAPFPPPLTSPAICPPPSHLIAACFTEVPNECVFGVASVDFPCPPPTRTGPRCGIVSRIAICSDTRTGPACTIGTANCPTRDLRCRVSAVAFCPDTQLCQAASAACGVDPLGGGVFQQQRINVGGGGFDPGIGVFQTGFNCPSVFDNCATRESFCPTQSFSCPSRLIICNQSQFVRCVTLTMPDCGVTRFNCPSRDIPCPTRAEPRCFASQVAICVDTRAGCQVQSVACGVDPAGGAIDPLGGGVRAFNATPGSSLIMPTVCDQCAIQTQTPDCGVSQACGTTQTPSCAVVTRAPHCGGGGGGAAAIVPTIFCPSRFIVCPTQFNCPSRYTPCQSQYLRCPSALDACPTRYQCPTLPNGCPGYTQF
ncbi:MAG: hypothetical protein ACJ74T_00265, partial [Pyrinomonadaceae bacterium]